MYIYIYIYSYICTLRASSPEAAAWSFAKS